MRSRPQRAPAGTIPSRRPLPPHVFAALVDALASALVADYGRNQAAKQRLDDSPTLRYRSAPQIAGGRDDETSAPTAITAAQAARQSRGHRDHQHGAAERTPPAHA